MQKINMGNLKQTPGVGVRNFLAELRGQSKLCKYTVKCTRAGCDTDIEYSDDIIKDQLVRGIADPEILSDLLGDLQPNRTLAQVVDFIATKEQAKTERGSMNNSTSGSVASAKHQKPPANKAKNCWASGESSPWKPKRCRGS